MTQNQYPTILPHRILLLGEAREEHVLGSGVITPGMLLQVNSAGKVVVHSVQGGVAEAMFALEDALQGNGIDDNYADGALVITAIGQKNTVFYGWLAAGNHVDPSTYLASNGDGTLIPVASADHAIAKCEDTLSSASDATKTRIRVRIL